MNTSTALVVIDMQLCAFDGKTIPPINKGAELLTEVGNSIELARKSQVPVIYIQHCAPLAGQPYSKDAHGWEIHPSIAPKPADTIVYKSQSSGFEGTNFEKILADAAIRTIATCGIQSEFCVTNTSLSALDLGFDVVVLKDAHGTVSNDEDEAQTIVDRQNALLLEKGANVMTVAAFRALLPE